ncbi:hypothetical protein ACTJKJ_26630 [Roseateles sp. 22389]|uniref:hypothetical protein n=1 Tax=Roseateles sp. 22389 TaxID=3453916 RepID=UPI003F83F39B
MSNYDIGDLLGSRSPAQIAAYLQDIGDDEEAAHFLSGAGGQSFGLEARPYARTGMVLGFIPAAPGSTSIQSISAVTADEALIGTQIKVTLDKFFVYKYPGWGTHTVLCEFNGKNQVAGESEELSFALRFDTRDGTSPSIAGAPIFMGLTVGSDGISFKGRVVNVRNSTDDVVLATLDTPAFKHGLTLLSTAQPALKPLASLAAATVGAVMKRRQNALIHMFELGLDFRGSATSARLRHGSYVVVQSDAASSWDWDDYEWNPGGMALHLKGQPEATPEFNYLVVGVSPSTGSAPV